jgi:hypothetical protein
MIGEACTIINRTSKPLEVIQNGVVRVLHPGENQLTTDWIRFAKQQHPRMGTFDEGGNGDYLVAVKGFDKPEECAMIPPGKEHPNNGLELFDRSTMSNPEARTATGEATGLAQPRRRVAAEMSPLPVDTSHIQNADKIASR